MSIYHRNGYDYDYQQLISENKMLLDRLDQMKFKFKTLEEMNMKLAERVKQQSAGMISMSVDHEKYIQYCVNNFNKQIQEATDTCIEWQKKASSYEASLREAHQEIGKLKRNCTLESNHVKANDQSKKRCLDESHSSDSEESSVRGKKGTLRLIPVKLNKTSSDVLNKHKKSHSKHGKKVAMESYSDEEASWTEDSSEDDSDGHDSSDGNGSSDDSSGGEEKHSFKKGGYRNNKLFWDDEMDKKLRKAVGKYGSHDWVNVSANVGVGNKEQCRKRWSTLAKRFASNGSYAKAAEKEIQGHKKTTHVSSNGDTHGKPEKSKTGRYSHREDDIILSAVSSRGSQDPALWKDLSAIFGRSETSVEQRWMSLLEEEEEDED